MTYGIVISPAICFILILMTANHEHPTQWRIRELLERLAEYILKAKKEKWTFGVNSIKYLGLE